jgi:formiminotetrahydrofolate cyclodeaminase
MEKERTLTDLSVTALLERFASADPTPGGGSAAALAGALGASLIEMVSAVSARKAPSAEVGDEMAALGRSAGTLTADLRDGVVRDAAAFDSVRAAFGLPKATDDEKKARKRAVQAAFKQAADTPLEVAQLCLRTADLALTAVSKGAPNVVTDGAVGLLLALTGIEGAVLNVAINLDSIQDEEYVSRLQAEIRQLLARSQALRSAVWATLQERLPSLSERPEAV